MPKRKWLCMKKSGSQKALKVLSIILIVFAIISLVATLLVLAGGGLIFAAISDGAATDVSVSGLETVTVATGLLMLLGIVSLLSAIFELIVGIFGVRGANNPQKIRPFVVLCIICLVLEVIGFGGSLLAGATDFDTITGGIIGLAIPIICLVLANNIKKENNL